MTKLSDLISSDPDYGIWVGKDIPLPTTEDIAREKDPEACERREYATWWKEEQPEFNRLKRLAQALGIQKVLVSPYSASPDLDGYYAYYGGDVDFISARGWGFAKEQIHSANRSDRPVILISYRAGNVCRTLAHEIGHHIYRMAGFTERERNAPISETMKGFFPNDEYVHKSRDEICAECFSEYLTKVSLRKAVERHCESILRRVNRYNPKATKTVQLYRA